MADAQYVVDIAAQMPAGEQTIAQLDALTANLMGAGKGAEHFQQAIVQVSSALDAAKAATVAANDALKTGQTEYALLERAALQASKAAERAALKGAVPPDVAAKAAQAGAAVNAYVADLKKLEATAAAATGKETAFAKSLDDVRKLSSHVDKSLAEQERAVKKLKGALPALGGVLGQVGGKIAGAVDDFGDLTESFGSSGAAAIVAAGAASLVAVGIAAVTAVAIAGTIAIAAWAIGLADSRRNTELATAAIEAIHPELIALRGTFASITAETGAHADELAGLAGRLREAKVSARDMSGALEAAALSEAALGKGGLEDFIGDIKAGKVAVSVLAQTTKDKLGGIVAKQMLGLSAQSQRAHDLIAGLFGGLNIEPALRGLKTLVDLLDANTAAGSAIKFLFESVFQPLINNAQVAAQAVEAFALGFLIGLTKLYIAVKPAIKAVSEFLGLNSPALGDALDAVAAAGEYLAPIIAAVAGLLAGTVVLGAAAAAAGLALLYAPIVLAISAFESLVGGVSAAWSYISALDFGAIGAAIMQGLVDGITGGAASVLGAITGAVQGAIDAAKHLLGIASPSKVFAEIGGYTAEGFAGGVEESAPQAQSALQAMVEPPAPSAGKGAAAAKGGGGASLDLSGSTFNFYGVEGAEDAEARMSEMFTRLIEGDVAQLGGEAAAPA